jgi:NAD(P)-dependent dehydrogenase (short-subunit alcohol dehydrogenase family)/acyl-CoA synthetase (AMP-forming)/AMP-acid ligase II
VAGRVVLITGASEGIGAATAVRLGRAGATVLLVARTRARLVQVRGLVEAAGGTAHVHPCDLSDPDAARALAEEVLRRYGRVDVVVSNAGRSIHRTVAQTADRFHDVTRTVAINYLGPVALLLALLPAMRAAGGAHIVNVSTSSLAAFAPGWSAYLGSKAAFDYWLRSAAPELRVDGVTVSTVYFGMVRTRMSAPTLAKRRVPAASPEEAAEMVAHAVAHRPRAVWPWWGRFGYPLAVANPGQLERIYAGYLRVSRALVVPRALHRAGVLRVGAAVRALRASRRYGATLAAALAAGPRAGIALVDAEGSLTYRQLSMAADACAAHLHPLWGRVGLAVGPGRDLVIAAVALGRLGVDVVLVPPETPAARLRELVASHRLGAIVLDGRYEGAGVPGLRLSTLALPAAKVPVPRRGGRLSVLTSGTTGEPKRVRRALPMRTVLGMLATHLRLLPLRPGRPFVLLAPPHHGYGLSYVAGALSLGIPVVLGAGLEPDQVLDLIERHHADVVVGLPVQLHRLVEAVQRRPGVPALRAIVSGAAPLTTELRAALVRAFGDVVYNLYGTTEGGWAAIATPADLAAAPNTVGRPPYGVQLFIRDAAGVALVPGGVGEVYVRGWLPHGQEWATGDIGHLDPVGRLILHGRTDAMIVSGGVNVYPAAVAAMLAEHPDVAEVQVSPVDDVEFGQRLAARIKPHPGVSLTSDALRAWQREHLPPAQRARDITILAE